MLSNTSEYALRALLELASTGDEGPVPVDTLSERLDVPRNYLSKILHQLARAEILTSTRGPHGGFELARAPERTSIGSVVEVFEPDRVQGRRKCLLGRPKCSDADPCAAHEQWAEVSEHVRTFFRTTTLADLKPRAGESVLSAEAAAGPPERPLRTSSAADPA